MVSVAECVDTLSATPSLNVTLLSDFERSSVCVVSMVDLGHGGETMNVTTFTCGLCCKLNAVASLKASLQPNHSILNAQVSVTEGKTEVTPCTWYLMHQIQTQRSADTAYVGNDVPCLDTELYR